MIIEYKDRKIEVTDYTLGARLFIVYTANYIDGAQEDLSPDEVNDLEENYFDAMYEAMPKGTGY